MKNIIRSLRGLFKKGKHNEIKILSLGVGLAMGLVLIAKVCFELSFDTFYPDSNRIYQIQENVHVGGEDKGTYGQVSGGVAPTMKDEIPEVEAATRAEWFGNCVLFTPDKSKYNATILLADSCFFDVLPRRMILGDAKEVLSKPLYGLVSETMARSIGKGENVIGQSFEVDGYPGRTLTIGGIFEDVPENTHLRYDILLSMASFVEMYQFDCTNGWEGCDRFLAYLKLVPGVTPESLTVPMKEVLDRHINAAIMKDNGIQLEHTLLSLEKVYNGTPEARQMTVMLLLIAFVLLFTAVMNYVLVVISSLVVRTREIAVHKCYGASGKNISNMIFSDTFVHLIASLIVALLLVLAFRGTVEELLHTSLDALITLDSGLLLIGVCLVIFLLAGFIPSQLFMRIPVAAAFRSFQESRRSWKRVLLFVQFVAAGFLVALLAVIGLQYERMINDNPGYSYENILYTNLKGVEGSAKRAVMDELRRLPEVEGVSTCYTIPMFGSNGDVVYSPGKEQAILHIADLYDTDENYIPLMEMSVLQGNNFDRATADSSQVMVSKLMADKLVELLDWKDGVVGKTVDIGGHECDRFTIIGVYDNIRIGSIGRDEDKPSALFYSKHPQPNLLIKLHTLNLESMKQVEEVLKKSFPNKDVVVSSYKTGMTDLYKSSRLFRDSVMLGGIVTLIISLIGLIGYTNDEISRRSKEIAIRKINGGTVKDILQLVSLDVVYLALPAVILGVIVSYIVGEKWLRQFSDKITLHPAIFISGAVLVLIIVFITVVVRCWDVANENPVKSLKSE